MEKSKSYGLNFIGMDDFIEKIDKINNEYGKKIDTLLSKAGDIAIAQSLLGRKKLVEETSSADTCGGILRESARTCIQIQRNYVLIFQKISKDM